MLLSYLNVLDISVIFKIDKMKQKKQNLQIRKSLYFTSILEFGITQDMTIVRFFKSGSLIVR